MCVVASGFSSVTKPTMTRFIMVNDRLVNIDHIVTVAECDNGDTKITLDNGEVLTAPSSQELDQAIMGCHYVVAVIPCHGVDALMLGPDREEYYNCCYTIGCPHA